MTLLHKRIVCHLICLSATLVFMLGLFFFNSLGMEDQLWWAIIILYPFLISLPVGWLLQREGLVLELWLCLSVGIAGWFKIQPFYSPDLGRNAFLLIFGIPIILSSILGLVFAGWVKIIIMKKLP